jgi:hypothetical protein
LGRRFDEPSAVMRCAYWEKAQLGYQRNSGRDYCDNRTASVTYQTTGVLFTLVLQ